MIQVAIVFALVILVGGPIAIALGLAGAVGLHSEGIDLITVPQRMFGGVDSFVLLAAPFYILAGDIMNRGGITERLIRLSTILVGRIRGGTAYANIAASVFFAGISGTAVSDTAALGQVFIKGMPREGYTKEFAAAVTVASSIIGPIIPPSVIMIIHASVAQLSVVDLFLAGIVPGLLLGAACAAVVLVKGRGGRLPKSAVVLEKGELPNLVIEGLLVVSLPAMVVFGTLSGAFTATEAGGVAVLYAVLLGRFVFRNLDFAGIRQALATTARTMSTLFLLLAAANIVSYFGAIAGVAEYSRNFGIYFAGQPVLFMFAVVALLLIVGCFMDGGPALVVLVPLLMPIARGMGIDPLQFSMVVVLSLTIGLITPPVGVCLYVACRIGEINISTLVKATLPFIAAEIGVVVLLVLLPGLSSWLPHFLRNIS